MDFGHTLGAIMDVTGVGKLMAAPPVRLRSPFLGGKTAKNAEPHKATKRRGKETKLQPKTDPSVKTYSFKSPDPARHKAVKVQQGGLKKEKNTVADNTVDMVADIKAINEGKAVILPNNQFQLPNGRIYGCHKIASGDRMFPISGDGLHTLSNDGYSVLGMLNKLGKEKTLSIISNMDRKPPISQTAINEALHIFDNLIK